MEACISWWKLEPRVHGTHAKREVRKRNTPEPSVTKHGGKVALVWKTPDGLNEVLVSGAVIHDGLQR